MKQIILWFIAACTVVVMVTGCNPSQEPSAGSTELVIRPIKTTVVKRSAVQFIRSYPATVLPARRAELSFRSGGRIIELPVRAMAAVKQGDVIARLDPRDFDAEVQLITSQLEQANAQLAGMTAGARSEDIAAIEAEIEAVAAEVRVAKEQLARTSKLLERGVITRAQVDDDRAKVDVASAKLKAQKENLNKARAGSRSEDVEGQEAAIRGLEAQLAVSQDKLADTVLRAPFDGIVSARHFDNFANVQANEKIITLQRVEEIELGFDIPAVDVTRLATGDQTLKSVARLDVAPES